MNADAELLDMSAKMLPRNLDDLECLAGTEGH